MAFGNYPSGRSYYGPAMYDTFQDPFVSYESQNVAHPLSSSLFNTGIYAGVGYGFHKMAMQNWGRKRGYDHITNALRWAEEASPGGILRTFQLSTLTSQFSSAAATTFVSPDQLAKSPRYKEYLTALLNKGGAQDAAHRLIKEGVSLRDGKLFWGQGSDVALGSASGLIPTKGPARVPGQPYKGPLPRMLEAHYLSLGLDPGERPVGARSHSNIKAFRREIEGLDMVITGGSTKLANAKQQLSAQFTEFMSRPNRLLQQPFEMQPGKTIYNALDNIWQRIFNKNIRLDVPLGTGTEMFGRMAKKYGLYMPAAFMAYQTADWLGRETIGAGPSDAVASAWTGSQLLISHAAQITGLHGLREMQEEMAPGSTTLKKLAAFPAMFAMGGATIAFAMRQMKMNEFRKAGMTAGEANAAAIKHLSAFEGEGILSRLGRQITEAKYIYSQPGKMGNFLRSVAEPLADGTLNYKFVGQLGPGKILAGLGAAIGAALVAPFIPGALVPSTRPDELAAIYSGEQEVPIRKGRWWEFGRTPYEGTRIDYFRPNWNARMAQRGKERMIWGEDEPNPISKFFIKEFTYDLEARHYKDRPYPITSLPFEDVPFAGPLLANTIGRLIKPPVLMHEGEWGIGGGAIDRGPGFGGRVATEMGETPAGMPIAPYGAQGLIGEQMYRMTEMIGLPGFMFESFKENVTGTGSFFEEQTQLESARRMAGFEREYWDLNLGGLLGSTEAFRRMFPHKRNQLELYNPIRNTMPEWLPGHGEKGIDFLHGDPYTKVAEGEIRLPGEGYATRFPELSGVDPADYPLVHQFKILADLAPYSEKFKLAKKEVQAARKAANWSEYEERIYATTMQQVAQRKGGKEFNDYKYLTPSGDIFGDATYYTAAGESSSAIAAVNRMKANNAESPGLISSLYGGYWELLSHNAETALDQLTPLSPYSKLVHMRTAIEDYESMQLYGTQNAFWNHPIRDFIRPFSQMTMASLGADGVPHHIQERRKLEDYFDILKYVKNARLANIARAANDTSAIAAFEANKDETLFGINPYTHDYTSIFRSMPRRERDYFNAFANVQTEEERDRILEMVPENMKPLYIARWRMALSEDMKKAKSAGYLSGRQEEQANKLIQQVQEESKADGMPTSQDLWAEYLANRLQGEGYGDWYRRTKLLPEMDYLPGPDWVGWHPSVDLEDIKLQVVENLGEDMHDYDLWPSRQARMQNKAYINNQASEEVMGSYSLSSWEMKSRVEDLLFANQIHNASVFVREGGSPNRNPSVTMEYNTIRENPGLEELLS